jgi:SAM-dependent methyltransferase
MKLHRKLAKLGRAETYHRAWRRAQRSIFRLPFQRVLNDADKQRLSKIQQRYADSSTPCAKYADIDHWLRVNRERVQDLKLHRSASQHVLDLGCGGGFFLFILKRLGHSVLGLDTDDSPLFRELLEVFEVPRFVWSIKPFEQLPDLGRKFDWITAFSAGFNRYRPGGRRWGTAEWDFFLQDLQQHLTPRSKIYLALNPMPSGDYWTRELHDFFARRGAEIERERIFFKNGLKSTSEA